MKIIEIIIKTTIGNKILSLNLKFEIYSLQNHEKQYFKDNVYLNSYAFPYVCKNL